MEELKMMIDSLKIQELRYDELIKLKAFLLKFRKIVMDDISIRRGEIASHGKGYGIRYICYSFCLVVVGYQMI